MKMTQTSRGETMDAASQHERGRKVSVTRRHFEIYFQFHFHGSIVSLLAARTCVRALVCVQTVHRSKCSSRSVSIFILRVFEDLNIPVLTFQFKPFKSVCGSCLHLFDYTLDITNCAAGSSLDDDCIVNRHVQRCRRRADQNLCRWRRIDKERRSGSSPRPLSASVVSTVLQLANDATSQKEFRVGSKQSQRECAD